MINHQSSVIKSGFTLIELLVVISLIGVLATLVLANLNAARGRARDATRKSDLKNISTALRVYYNDFNKYPASNSSGLILGCGTGGTGTCNWEDPFSAASETYINSLPTDPLPNMDYRYTQVDLDSFTLSACLENKSDDNCSGTASWCSSSQGCVYTISQ